MMLPNPTQKLIDNEKVEQIIRSCKTLKQLDVARNVSRLFEKKYGPCADRLGQVAIIMLYESQIRKDNWNQFYMPIVKKVGQKLAGDINKRISQR